MVVGILFSVHVFPLSVDCAFLFELNPTANKSVLGTTLDKVGVGVIVGVILVVGVIDGVMDGVIDDVIDGVIVGDTDTVIDGVID